MNIFKFFIACILLFSPFLYADPLVKINLRFKAIIVNRTCTVAPQSKNLNVVLGTWSTNNMKKIGDQTRPTPFTIRLLDCTAKSVSLSFTGPKNITNPQLLALSNDSTARNIAIQIFDKDRQLLPIETFTLPLNINNSKDLQLNFSANYITTDKSATAGKANSAAIFILNYD